ncbi:MAG: glycosyltransferase family 4 protein [Planctomycetota bacterium]
MNAARGLSLAYVCADPGIPIDGAKGAAVHFRELGRALGEQGVRLAAFAARADHDPPAVPFPARVVPRQGSSGARRELDLLAGAASFLGALAESGGCDAVYERLSPFGIAGLIFSREQNIPHVVEVNAPLLEEQARFRSLELTALAAGAVMEVLANASLVLAVARGRRRPRSHAGRAAARVRVFANAQPRSVRERVRERAPAGIHRHRGHRSGLAQAVARHPVPARCVRTGSGATSRRAPVDRGRGSAPRRRAPRGRT